MSNPETLSRFQRMLSHAAKAFLVYAATAAPIEHMPTCVEQVYQANTEGSEGLSSEEYEDFLITDELDVVTYNIKSGERGVQEVADVLAEQEPDVICTQEDVASNVSTISDTTGLHHHAEGWARESDGQPFGNVTYSKSEIIDSYTILLPRIYDEQRSLLVTKHLRGEETFYVLNTHLTPKNTEAVVQDAEEDTQISERDLQALYVVSEEEKLPDSDPVFLCGDLNDVRGSSTYNKIIGHGFIDAVSTSGGGKFETFAGSNRQIDFIFGNSNKWFLYKMSVAGQQQSDHCLVRGVFVQLAETVDA